ncbi:hypothetical protein [Psychrobacillus sp. FJAT-21963]|uniref:hypothetical protein n=1 Tax=Psychrobacillus sp. FJAT-21963 TaxID=1712028 RepID=UPI0012E22718|nr:hypothetical protein [Psychrobacillus sp. FJAT-21963]
MRRRKGWASDIGATLSLPHDVVDVPLPPHTIPKSIVGSTSYDFYFLYTVLRKDN